ncbi:Uncharacterized protein Adt_42226 [Abeliophyllum distichum]|uniref:Uncharacterized protein n=1 Tax=Abeliophyllum distichum TaxID=126358 RepID=A0ABD1PR68_9LAMI
MNDTAKLMQWHSIGRLMDEDEMQHPVDGKAWWAFKRGHLHRPRSPPVVHRLTSIFLQEKSLENDEDTCRGRVLKGRSPFLDSTSASNVPREATNQFSEDTHYDEPRFSMYEAQLYRMERTIAHLLVNLQ